MNRDILNTLYSEFYKLQNDKLHLVTTQTNVKCSKSKPVILFLDELNRAPIDTRQASLQLVLEKRLHKHILPAVNGKRALVVAAVNPTEDYQVDELDPALLDRFLTLEVEADTNTWLDWSAKNDVNQIVRDFIIENPTKLHWQPKDGGIGATPRSWTKLAKFIDDIDNISGELHFPIVKGKIGQEIGGQFISFLKNYVDIIKVEDVEKLTEKLAKKTGKIEKIGEGIAKLIIKSEAVQKTDLTKQLFDKCITGSVEDAKPLMGMLYAIEIELLNGLLTSWKASDASNYSKLAEFDNVMNNKGLFKKIVSQIAS